VLTAGRKAASFATTCDACQRARRRKHNRENLTPRLGFCDIEVHFSNHVGERAAFASTAPGRALVERLLCAALLGLNRRVDQFSNLVGIVLGGMVLLHMPPGGSTHVSG
jgi:hypothetical protein